MSCWIRATTRVVRLALLAFPAAFRSRHGSDLAQAFEDAARQAGLRRGGTIVGGARILRVCVRTAFNLLLEGFRERHATRTRRARTTPRERRSRMAERVLSDLVRSFREVARRPAFAIVAVLTLGLGVGANAAIFSVIDGVLLRALPYPEAERLVTVWMSVPSRGIQRFGMSLHDYEDMKAGTDVFEPLAAYNANAANLGGIDAPQRIQYTQVTPGFFAALGIDPQLGRTFRDEENLPGRADVVVVSHAFWQDHLGADDGAIGRTVLLGGRPMTVIGVMPEGFAFPSAATVVWKPFGMLPEEEGGRGGRWVSGIARLSPGTTLDAARVELSALAATLERMFPETNQDFGIHIEPLQETMVAGVRQTLLVLWGAVGLVLLIAGANVAGLVLARAVDRSREFALRAALGAGRQRLITQILAESAPIALLGGLAGIAFAWGGVRALSALAVNRIPRMSGVTIDGSVLGYSLAIALTVGLGFSLIPAFTVARADVAARIREGARESAGRKRVNARETLVVAQVSLAVVVLVGAALLVRTFAALTATGPGFDATHLLTFRIAPSWTEIEDRERAVTLIDEIVREVSAAPGIVSAGAVNTLPLSGNMWGTTLWKEGETPEEGRTRRAFTRVITPGYLETLGLPLLRGRPVLDSDRADRERVALINRNMAESFWPDADPIGQRFSMDGILWFTIIGIVGDERFASLSQPAAPLMYIPFRQGRFGHFQDWGMSIVVRTTGDPAGVADVVRERAARMAPSIPIFQLATFGARIDTDVSPQRLNATLFSTFATLALVLAAIGVYGQLSYLVGQRTREIGVRMAMGARPSVVVSMVLGHGLRLGMIGALIGIAAALALTHLLDSLLFGVTPRDPAALAGGIAVLLGVAALACAVPAWRASRIEPTAALRAE